ncbi:nucleotidyl transferase AbiEii/AbiGii toxin family protein [Bradyrhizobium sp. CB3481]|uniref:nucleotidyl transferase AbiEii/AbiGii toxin family protein n=1 Tax=Bradyrhizobium sp. CB3481 TaxID=3039158 RepID=UPI0024B14CC9|nr:nucleotidyl transferase AbiEii/AbiGii toxin family protein [Bradyrhizobium sp. CB3481]WFU14348.1 nucleotidyl transferase AbiEii/AbiGii toxin family protein [Bradyrhizobium sp. CB3481]
MLCAQGRHSHQSVHPQHAPSPIDLSTCRYGRALNRSPRQRRAQTDWEGGSQTIRGTKLIEQHFESRQAFGSRQWRANQDRRYYCGLADPPSVRSVSEAVEEAFGYAEIQVTSFQDLYAGKIVAALDHQHPRDFLAICLPIRACGDALRRAFIVYMLSHHRPMSEALAPKRKDISNDYVRGFIGMAENDVAS